jgi:hypothetical protein
MDISTFYAVTSATCFALVGLWWSVVKDKPEWFADEAKKRLAGGVYASFLIPGVMSLAAQIGVDNSLIWRGVFVIAAGAGPGMKNPEGFWAERAEELEWFEKWDKVLDDSNKPFYKWFVGGKTNIVHNALDRHLKTWRKNKLALIWVSEDGKEERTFSYYSINRDVNSFANIIKAMGVTKGDRVTIYWGASRKSYLPCWPAPRSARSIRWCLQAFRWMRCKGRIDDSESKLVITADGSWINGKIFELKRTVDEAIKTCPSVENVIVVRRTGHEVPMEAAATTGITIC